MAANYKSCPYCTTSLTRSHSFISTDVKDASIVLADETLKFTGKSENKEYEVDIAFFKPVDANGSTYKVLPRSVQMHVMKKDKSEGEFWPRLLQDKNLEKNQVRIVRGGALILILILKNN